MRTPTMQNITTEEFFVIGGGKIYELFLPFIKTLYMTFVDVEIDGDTKIPDINKYEWDDMFEEHHDKDNKHKYSYTFLTLKKNKKHDQ